LSRKQQAAAHDLADIARSISYEIDDFRGEADALILLAECLTKAEKSERLSEINTRARVLYGVLGHRSYQAFGD
jgi:hypothetical protein